MRNRLIIAGLYLSLAILASPAGAFEERRAVPVPDATEAQPKKQQESVGLDRGPKSPEAEKEKGWSIPGLGSLNLLPKLDFGLELMYGDTQPHNLEDPVAPADDMTIRGSVKRRF